MVSEGTRGTRSSSRLLAVNRSRLRNVGASFRQCVPGHKSIVVGLSSPLNGPYPTSPPGWPGAVPVPDLGLLVKIMGDMS